MHRLFVYGSLMQGEPNHAMLGGGRFIASVMTAACYMLVDLGEYPALLDAGATAVHGELYDVDMPTRQMLDAFEEHPMLYRRSAVRLADGSRAEAYFYVTPPADPQIISSGDWRKRALG